MTHQKRSTFLNSQKSVS